MATERQDIPDASGPAAENAGRRDAQGYDAGSVVSDLSTNDFKHSMKEDLLHDITSIESSGSFASFAEMNGPIQPGLFVEGIGDIAIPLSDSQARQLIAKASQAPYGKGSETLVDTSVRNTWEIDAAQFEFRAPHWPGYLGYLCTCAAERLGIKTSIRAEIYKMLIYERGAMFKAHTDTEKIPGMFGTLVISLPSPHQGGEVVVKHGGEMKVFRTSDWPQTFACWYSDVSHEVLPVISGYRWVLTYNLAIDQSQAIPSATGLHQSETRALRHTLRRWLSREPRSRENKYIYHVLDHDYTEANASLNALKAPDLARVQALKEACAGLPVDIFLALLEKKEMGNVEMDYCDVRYSRHWQDQLDDYDEEEQGFHPLDDVFETDYQIKTLVDLDGQLVAQALHLSEADILDEQCFEDLDAEEEYEGYMGNWGPTATHWYRVTAVAIVPRDSVVPFISCTAEYCPLRHDYQAPIGYYARTCLLPHGQESSLTALTTLWDLTRDKPQGRLLDGNATQDVLKAALRHGRYDLFEEAALGHRGLLHLDFFTWVVEDWLSAKNGDANERFKTIEKGLSSAISTYPRLDSQVNAIQCLVPIIEEDPYPDRVVCTWDGAAVWAREKLRSYVDYFSSRVLLRPDGLAMVELSLYFEDPASFLSETVAPIFKQRHDAVAFRLCFLSSLLHQSWADLMPSEDFQHLYWALLKSFIASTDFTKVYCEARLESEAKKARFASEQPTDSHYKTAVSDQTLINLFTDIIENCEEPEDTSRSLASNIAQDAPGFRGLEIHTLWLYFLHALSALLIEKKIPLDTECYQQLFSAILKAYLDNFVGCKPVNDDDLARRCVSCSCSDCEWLNEFLKDPGREVGEFSVNKRRMHLHRKLDEIRADCIHETDRSTLPQTLVVTKTFREQAKRQQNWEARRALAVKQFEAFKLDHLRLLLGAEYFTIIHMERISGTQQALPSGAASTASQPRQPLAETGQPSVVRPPVVGEKRKLQSDAEVIDLTSD